jgi:Golgi apyrase
MIKSSEQWPEAGPSVIKRTPASSQSPSSSLRRRATSTFSTWSKSRRYAVIVDAGSSGSRMQIYSWKDARVDKAQKEKAGDNTKILPSVEKGTWEGSGKDWQIKVEPGLSSFGDHPQDLDQYLTPLFDHAATIIPKEALADTPVYFLATAGMRLLSDEKRNAVLQTTCDFIEHKSPFSLGAGGCAEHVQVITGEEEGLLGWIAINYLMDGFHFKPTVPISDSLEGTKGRSTYGFLDMGGASTQIAFEPSGKAQDTAEVKDLTPVKLRMLDGTDVTHNVFVTTFLGFGTNKARERYIDALASSTESGKQMLDDPCLPSGLELIGENKTSLMGSGSFTTCLSSLEPLLDKHAKCNRPPCLFHGVHVPAIDFSVNHFIGVSEYWFSSNDVFKLGGVYDFVSFQKAAQAFCKKPWKELETELTSGQVYGPQVNKDRLELQCFKAAWMTTVLHEGIGLPRLNDQGGGGDGKPHADSAQDKADEKNLFQSVNDVDGLAVSWTLGKAVMEASREIAPAPLTLPASSSVSVPSGQDGMASQEWLDSVIPSWQKPSSSSLLKGKTAKMSGAAVLFVVFLAICTTIACCFLRGRSAKATKRRNRIKEIARGASCLKKRPRGDYVLANMEEGSHDMDTLASTSNGDAALSSDTSGDDETDTLKGNRHKLRRSSGNGLLATLLVPVQKLALALGVESAILPVASSSSSNGSSRPSNKRKVGPSKLPLRRTTTLPSSSSLPSSPLPGPLMSSNSIASITGGGAISRPASRASNSVLSPRLHVSGGTPNNNNTTFPSTSTGSMWMGSVATVEASGGFFAHQLPASSTASARSSRAASPAFGSSVNGRPNRNGNPPTFTRRAWEEE